MSVEHHMLVPPSELRVGIKQGSLTERGLLWVLLLLLLWEDTLLRKGDLETALRTLRTL